MNGQTERASRRERFARTYREDREFIRGLLRRGGVPSADVDDAVQEVFVLLHQRLPELDDRGPLRSWLRAVAIHVSNNRRRSVGRRRSRETPWGESPDVDSLADGASLTPDECLARKEVRDALVCAYEQLDAAKRRVLIMTALEERTAAEIAALTGAPANTVSSRLRAARLRMADALTSPSHES